MISDDKKFHPEEISALTRKHAIAIWAWPQPAMHHLGFSKQMAAKVAKTCFNALESMVAKTRLMGFYPQRLGSTVWAFDTALYAALAEVATIEPHNSGYISLAEGAKIRVNDIHSHSLANTASAFATVGYVSMVLSDTTPEVATSRPKDFTSQSLAAFATTSHASPVLFDATTEAAKTRMKDLSSPGLVNTACALAKLAKYQQHLLMRSRRWRQAVGKISVLEITRTQYGPLPHLAIHRRLLLMRLQRRRQVARRFQFSKSGKHSLDSANRPSINSSFDAIAEVASSCWTDFNSQSLANMLWAFATDGHTSPVLIDAIAGDVKLISNCYAGRPEPDIIS